MKCKKTGYKISVKPFDEVSVKECGNYLRITKTDFKNTCCRIKKISKDSYILKRNGKEYEFKHSEKRLDNIASLKKSFDKLRDIIRCNTVYPENCRWVTLTYREADMLDSQRLYDDFRKFIMRLKYYCKKNSIPPFEYIDIIEPMGINHNSYHHHVIFIWNQQAPFIPNKTLRAIWGFGFVKIKSLNHRIDIASYITAYLTDLPLEDALDANLPLNDIKNIKEIPSGNNTKKRFIKGGRLHIYPVNFQLYRCSKHIKRPKTYRTNNNVILQQLESEGVPMVYEKNLYMSDPKNDFGFGFFMNIKQYNRSNRAKKKYFLINTHRKSKVWRDMWAEFCEPYTREYPPQNDDSINLIYAASENYELINESQSAAYYAELDLAEKYRK